MFVELEKMSHQEGDICVIMSLVKLNFVEFLVRELAILQKWIRNREHAERQSSGSGNLIGGKALLCLNPSDLSSSQ